jgi:hypothetical protein
LLHNYCKETALLGKSLVSVHPCLVLVHADSIHANKSFETATQ